MKRNLLIFSLISCHITLLAQSKGILVGVNLGSTISLTNSSSYKPGVYLNGQFSFQTKHNEDHITADISFHNFKNKRFSSDVVKLIDMKGGYRFFPSTTVPIYLHPSLGLGFFVDGSGGSPSVSIGAGIGYLPNFGSGKLNIFAEYTTNRFPQSLSLLNLGVGYLFRLKYVRRRS